MPRHHVNRTKPVQSVTHKENCLVSQQLHLVHPSVAVVKYVRLLEIPLPVAVMLLVEYSGLIEPRNERTNHICMLYTDLGAA
jgi:hypothetical protein